MTQNRSHAVMSQRAEPPDSLDFFPTPPWATRALFTHVLHADLHTVWEPACGDGSMSRVLSEYTGHVVSSDVHDYGWGHPIHDFLMPFTPGFEDFHWIITNPPFNLAEKFVLRALEIARMGVAILVRTVFIESVGRYERLFRDRPPAVMAQFSERVPMFRGRLDENGSTATAYCWLVWFSGSVAAGPPKLIFIPPCRTQLERPGDYPKTTGAL